MHTLTRCCRYALLPAPVQRAAIATVHTNYFRGHNSSAPLKRVLLQLQLILLHLFPRTEVRGPIAIKVAPSMESG